MLLLLIDLIVIGLLLQVLKPLITLLYRNKQLFSSHVVLSSLNTSDIWQQTNQSNKIPRILHQTTATEVIPDNWVQSQRSCKDAYSDFEYRVNLSSVWVYHEGSNWLQALLIIIPSYGLMIQHATSSLLNTLGSWTFGTTMLSLFSVQTLFGILFCTTMAAFT